MISLRARLVAAASLVLLVFLGLGGLALESAFRDSARTAQQQRLQGFIYALLGAAQEEAGRLRVNDAALPEPRFNQPQSGLDAALLDDAGAVVWRAPGASGALPRVPVPDVGATWFDRLSEADRFALAYGLRWIGEDGVPRRYTVLALEDPEDYETQLAVFRRTLWAWLCAVAVALLGALLLLQRWGLAPVRRLAAELRAVEAGHQPLVERGYPVELAPLTGALNAMIRGERGRQERQRNALGDLAHSLKTPLAVLRGVAEGPRLAAEERETLAEQVGRMQRIVDHQLAKAATRGPRVLAAPVPLAPLVEKIAEALRKVYRDKVLVIESGVAPRCAVRIDEEDLYELLGNLLDNAAKWCRGVVRVSCDASPRQAALTVEDDGPGFPPDAEALLARGARADTRAPGHGLGLAAVADIVQGYEGSLRLGRSTLGGARVAVTLPT